MTRSLAPFRAWHAVCALLLLSGCATAPELPQRHAIAAANPHAARAGLEMLRAGGSAVDAAIAAQMVLTLVEPQSSGIGGGAFLLHFAPGNTEQGVPPVLRGYEGRETAPAAAGPDLFLDASGEPLPYRERTAGGRPVGVPGAVRMLEMAHREHGTLPWARLFRPAIRLAEEGFPVSPRLHDMIASNDALRDFPAARRYFFTGDGAPLPVGHTLRNPALADTLRRIADDGAGALHEGEIARDIVRAVNTAPKLPGAMTLADLAGYEARAHEPVCVPYRAWRVCGFGPPSSGGIATLQMLGLLERFDMARVGPASPQAVHLISEAGRLAFADRDRYVADADYVPVPVAGLLDRRYLAERARAISGTRSLGRAMAGVPPRQADTGELAPDTGAESSGTSHVSVIDGDGNAVALTTSVGTPFGARLLVRGFMLNSQLSDFAARPVQDGSPVANRAEPGKRPRSSMSPTLAIDRDGRLAMTLGSPGGPNIIGYVTRTLVATLDGNLPMQEAIALPNHANRNGPTLLERGTALESLAPALRALGHEVEPQALVSGLHGLRVTPRGIDGGADPRREGVVLGD